MLGCLLCGGGEGRGGKGIRFVVVGCRLFLFLFLY